jgi:Fic family protein
MAATILKSLPLWQKALVRGISAVPHHLKTRNTQRPKLLQSIYEPAFGHLKPGSPEYETLANSGKVWEDHFRPRDLEPWLETQTRLKSTLESVDKFRIFFKDRPELRSLVTHYLEPEWAHQSTAIEANPLLPADAFLIAEGLESQLFSRYDGFETISTQALSDLDLPPASDLASQNPSLVAELRNHIVVSRHISNSALANPGTPGISLNEIKLLTRVLLQDTDSEQAAKYSWGPRVPLGEFRALPISVRSNPLRIFPYHQEVPACMKRLFEWRDETHAAGQLHPLIFATKLCVYFASVHPFADGNGRASRVLMADYLIRQGFLPVVFEDLDRLDYLGMISEAQDGEPEGLCTYVAQTALDMMFTISLR